MTDEFIALCCTVGFIVFVIILLCWRIWREVRQDEKDLMDHTWHLNPADDHHVD